MNSGGQNMRLTRRGSVASELEPRLQVAVRGDEQRGCSGTVTRFSRFSTYSEHRASQDLQRKSALMPCHDEESLELRSEMSATRVLRSELRWLSCATDSLSSQSNTSVLLSCAKLSSRARPASTLAIRSRGPQLPFGEARPPLSLPPDKPPKVPPNPACSGRGALSASIVSATPRDGDKASRTSRSCHEIQEVSFTPQVHNLQERILTKENVVFVIATILLVQPPMVGL